MKIVVVGVGYVGIHSVVNLTESINQYKVVGYDINKEKIALFNKGIDVTDEVGNEKISEVLSGNCKFTSDVTEIKDADIYIIAVPTDASASGELKLEHVLSATEIVGLSLEKGSVVVYESTVYPGLTREKCFPILEEKSKLKIGLDIDVVYTPERVDPGNKINTVKNVPRVISGTSKESIKKIKNMYEEYISEMIVVSTIEVAESVKILENTQRDINIALMNNFAILMDRIDVDFEEVLNAAKSKWNFLNFTPGLVGGHCIGIDPYYLIEKMKMENVDSTYIQSARDVNEYIIEYVKEKIYSYNPKNILYIGCTFKANTNDIRNSKHLEIIQELKGKFNVDVYDPIADIDFSISENEIINNIYDCCIVGIMHSELNYSFLEKIKFQNCINLTTKKIMVGENIWNLI